MPTDAPSLPPSITTSLVFPSASHSISSTLTQLTRANLSLTNRLHSIFADAAFVQRVARRYDLPLVANERCGGWYIPHSDGEGARTGSVTKAGSAYFKSTDGHHGQWAFSLRRLNVQVLDVIERCGKGGCIIVDSTRKGKSTPDALSKTIPIWISVLNRLLFPYDEVAGELRTPENVVGRSEHAQMEQRAPMFVVEAQSLGLDLEGLRVKLGGKPMLPIWVTPDMRLDGAVVPQRSADRNLIVLCTASSRDSSSGSLGSAYVQGAADDSEAWALGLDAALFWTHSESLLSTSEDDLPRIIADIVAKSKDQCQVREAILVKPTGNVWIGSNATAEQQYDGFDVVVSCSEKSNGMIASKMKDRYLHLSCTSGKVGSRQLRAQLTKLERIAAFIKPDCKALVTCHTGRDLAVGGALALICLRCDEHGRLSAAWSNTNLGKTQIKHRLSWIMVSMPDAAPSRATLQSVNAFLLG